MDSRYILINFIAIAFLFTACDKDELVVIDTLSKGGDTFHFGERVVLWAGVNGNLDKLNYEWTCTGGTFEGSRTQNLYENLWIAPNEPGNYIIEVKAKAGKESDVRKTSMKVTNYFFDYFEDPRNRAGWTASSATRTFSTMTDENGKEISCVLLSPSSNTANGHTRLNVPSLLVPPFSIQTKLGYNRYRSPGTASVTTTGQAFYFSLFFEAPSDHHDKPYIREIRLEIAPNVTGTRNNWRLRMNPYTTATGTSVWSANDGNNRPNPAPFGTSIQGRDEIFVFDSGKTKTFTFTIDEHFNFTVKVDGEIWIDKSSVIRDYLKIYNVERDMKFANFRLYTPRKSSASAAANETELYITSVRINNDKTAIGGDVNNVGFEDLD